MASCGLLLEGACNNKKQRKGEQGEEQLRSRMHIEVVSGSGGVQELEVVCTHSPMCMCACSIVGCINLLTVHANTLDPRFCVHLNSFLYKDKISQRTAGISFELLSSSHTIL